MVEQSPEAKEQDGRALEAVKIPWVARGVSGKAGHDGARVGQCQGLNDAEWEICAGETSHLDVQVESGNN